MTERLLQFIWQFQYFNHRDLITSSNESLQVIFQGQLNHNQGPDFINAKIKTGTTTWAGHIELHLKTSDWIKHRHQDDINYKNVILHVVWENDSLINTVPVLELRGNVPGLLLNRYEELMNSRAFIPCGKNIATVKDITWKKFKERILAERLIRKAKTAEQYAAQNNHHWEETFWWMLAKNFGMKVNAEAFEAMARTVSLTLLGKYSHQILQVEAILFGQAGLLENEFTEEYPKLLQREYRFLKAKHHLTPVSIPVHFLRMRPVNFPTIRLAQLAVLITNSSRLFSTIRDAESVAGIYEWFDVTANDYWHYHYRFDEETSFKKKSLGKAMISNIIINTICPLLFTYGMYQNENRYKDRALRFLEHLSAESNNITKGFGQLSIENKNAFDSQALLELKNEYCNKKRCLNCSVGNSILQSAPGNGSRG